jgi:hypothetical protein
VQAEFTEHRILNKNDQQNKRNFDNVEQKLAPYFLVIEDNVIFSISSSEVEEEENSNDEDDDDVRKYVTS